MRFTPDPPTRPGRPSARALRFQSPRLFSPGGKLPSKFHPRSLMYAELYGRNSKFGMAVLGAFTMSFHPLVLSFQRVPAARARRLPTRLGPYKRQTRVILIRTRPRGAEVKASFLLGVSTKTPSAFARALAHIQRASTALSRASRKRTLPFSRCCCTQDARRAYLRPACKSHYYSSPSAKICEHLRKSRLPR